MDEPDLWALFDHRPAPTYYKGCVAVLGDAAHASTPHQGAGAGQALEDAYILATLLAEEKTHSASGIVAAFQAYDAIRRPRSQKVVRTSRAAGEMYAFRGPAGDDLAKIREDLSTRLRWIWDEDMSRQADEARAALFQNLNGIDLRANTTKERSSSLLTRLIGAYRSVFGDLYRTAIACMAFFGISWSAK